MHRTKSTSTKDYDVTGYIESITIVDDFKLIDFLLFSHIFLLIMEITKFLLIMETTKFRIRFVCVPCD